MIDIDGLNDQQLEAVLTIDGPLLVLAGAGSGKTRVITYRLAHIVDQGVDPKHLLCVTFTNKAAFEMRMRARGLVGKSVRRATMSTFHALGSKILRDHPERVGLRKGFTISDGAEQLGFLRRILRKLRIDDRRFDAKQIMVLISRAKNAGLDAAAYRAQGGHLIANRDGPLSTVGDGAADEAYTAAAIEAYERYEAGLRAQNVVDFDDLLLLTGLLLSRDAEVLESLQARWQYVMIDEYQDTNGAQLELMTLLAGARRNLCVVGDDDQSIYGWRGADIANILGFGEHFPGAKTIKLEMNYRSTGSILSVANSIIEKNTQRHDKVMRALAGPGDPVKIVALEDEEEEAERIATCVGELLSKGLLAKDVAVLFRSNVQSRQIELAFRRAHIPYRVTGGMELFDRREVKDAIAYLKLLHNPEDEQALRRIVNYPARGIGDTSLAKIDTWARAHDLPLCEGLAQVDQVPGVSTKASDAVVAFVQVIGTHRKLLGRRKISTVTSKLFEAIGLEYVLFESSDDAVAASRRVDNVREVTRQVERYEARLKKKRKSLYAEDEEDEVPEATLEGFLADLALGARDDGQSKEDRDDQVVLSTIHASKGLEWQHVFLIGAEEELLPHQRTIDGDGEIEEERRLAYVATTRAREHLTITWAKTRTRWGRIIPRIRSRFLEALPEDCIQIEEDGVVAGRTEAEKEAVAQSYMDAIRAKLGS